MTTYQKFIIQGILLGMLYSIVGFNIFTWQFYALALGVVVSNVWVFGEYLTVKSGK